MLWVHPWVLLQGSPLLSSVVCQYVPVKRAYLFLDIAAAGWVDYVPSGTRNCFRCNRVLLNFSKPWGSNSPCLPWPPLVRCQLCVGNTSIEAAASVGQEASACQEQTSRIYSPSKLLPLAEMSCPVQMVESVQFMKFWGCHCLRISLRDWYPVR